MPTLNHTSYVLLLLIYGERYPMTIMLHHMSTAEAVQKCLNKGNYGSRRGQYGLHLMQILRSTKMLNIFTIFLRLINYTTSSIDCPVSLGGHSMALNEHSALCGIGGVCKFNELVFYMYFIYYMYYNLPTMCNCCMV